MKKCVRTVPMFLLGMTLLPVAGCSRTELDTAPVEEPSALRVVASGLDNPFEILWGPDGYLWVTERTGKRVTRVEPSYGEKTTVLSLDTVLVTEDTQDGLLGMALDPGLLQGTGNDYVYLAYTYDADPSPEGLLRQAKITRYAYDAGTGKLVSPVDLIAGLPASVGHNSGGLVLGPDGKLYYTIGDQGHNQAVHACDAIRAQELPSAEEVAASNFDKYQGKVLRLNLDGSIPLDNPTLAGVQSHLWSYGHRNAQGLAFGPDGALYCAEHGPKTDDEINLIEPGMNYGWPHVVGARDDQAYVYANWSASVAPPCAELTYSDLEIPGSVPQQKESEWNHPDFRPPLKSLYTVPSGYDFKDPACAEGERYFLCWPTVAPSSLAVYAGAPAGTQGPETSLLMTSLKLGQVLRMKLGAGGGSGGERSLGEAVVLFHSTDRYRDLALHPDGKTIFVSTDSKGYLVGPGGKPTRDLANPGSILAFRVPE